MFRFEASSLFHLLFPLFADVGTARNDNSQQNPTKYVAGNGVNVGEFQQEESTESTDDHNDAKPAHHKWTCFATKSAKFIIKLHVFSIEIITTSEFVFVSFLHI